VSADDWLAAEFDRCWPWLDAALAQHPVRTHEREHVWAALQSGDAQLWPTPNSACLTEIVRHPTGVKFLHGWLSGGDLAEIKQTVATIENVAREWGCSHASITGRRGWLRAFEGYADAGALMVKEL
jgi:hypothetical protein